MKSRKEGKINEINERRGKLMKSRKEEERRGKSMKSIKKESSR